MAQGTITGSSLSSRKRWSFLVGSRQISETQRVNGGLNRIGDMSLGRGDLFMRYWTIAIACCFSGFGSGWLIADENDNTRQQKSDTRAESYQRLIERFDRDGDGRLNDQERAAARVEFERRRQQDGNQNGSARSANDRNRSARGANNRSRTTDDRRAELLKRFDANKNGKLDPPELTRMRQSTSRSRDGGNSRGQRPSGNSRMSREELLKKFDANQNGRLDGDEIKKVRETFSRSGRDSVRPSAPKRGRLDRDELMKKFDLDNSGELDADERKQALAAMRKKKSG